MLWVVLLSQACGLGAVLLLVALRGRGAPELSRLLPAVGAGAAGAAGLFAFYRALAIGTMSIVAPIAATGMCLPAAVGIAQGDHLGALRVAGMVAAIGGVVLASRESVDTHQARRVARASLLLAVVAALGFGTFALGLRSSARVDVLWALVAARVGSVAPLIAAVAILRPPGAGAVPKPLADRGRGAARRVGQRALRPRHAPWSAERRRRRIFALPASHGDARAAAARRAGAA